MSAKPKKTPVTQLTFVDPELPNRRDHGHQARKTDISAPCPSCGAPNAFRREDWDRSVRVAKKMEDKSKWTNELSCTACHTSIAGPRWHRSRESAEFRRMGVETARIQSSHE